MSVIRIQGLQRLHGEISIQGSKNGVLPVMAAALLHSGDPGCFLYDGYTRELRLQMLPGRPYFDCGYTWALLLAGAGGGRQKNAFLGYAVGTSFGQTSSGQYLLSRRMLHRKTSY